MLQVRQIFVSMGIFIILSACVSNTPVKTDPKVFEHDFDGTPVPWSKAEFDDEPGKFTFALFSDLTGGERDGVFSIAVEQLRLLRPEFIIGVGDLIEGGTVDRDQLNREWNAFDERAARAHAPLFHVGGNHDLTNPEMWEVWEERYGKRYYHFIYKNVLFLVLDTEDNPPDLQRHVYEIRKEAIELFDTQGRQAFLDSEYGRNQERKTGRISAEQAAYFRAVIARYPDVRWTFLMMHKPAWERIDEENFASIESTLGERPYTVFHGHLHSYHHEQRLGRDYIRLGTTGGSHVPGDPAAIDHVTLVTVSEEGADIANLRMSGIFDKSGNIPLDGDERCLEECTGK